jgi:hypothetical protein
MAVGFLGLLLVGLTVLAVVVGIVVYLVYRRPRE